MKSNFAIISASFLLASSLCVSAAEKTSPNPTAEKTGAAKQDSPEFARMKSLIGNWTGKTDMGEGPVDVNLQYRLLAGGSVLEERVFQGTPHEMVTMYYDLGGKLAMTHYCILGNRPAMRLKSSDSKTINLDFDPTCGINPKKETHMHAISITFDDPDTITTSCRGLKNGEDMPEHPATFKRVKS